MVKKFFIFLLIVFPVVVLAENSPDISAFRHFTEVAPAISVPTVVEVPIVSGLFSIPV